MPTVCSIISCYSRKGRNNQLLSFHRLPRNPSRRKLWLEAIGPGNLNNNAKQQMICSAHFEENDFNRTMDIVRLRDDAVPSLFNTLTRNSRGATKTKDSETLTSTSQGTTKRKPLKYKICRVCMTDSDLEPVVNELERSFLAVSGTQTHIHDALQSRLPLALCSNCLDDFYKCLAFRENVRRATEALYALKTDGKLIARNIKRLASSFNNIEDTNCGSKKEDSTSPDDVKSDGVASIKTEICKDEDNDITIEENYQQNEITIYYTKSEEEISDSETTDTAASNVDVQPPYIKLAPNSTTQAEPTQALDSKQTKINTYNENVIDNAGVIDHNYCVEKPLKIEEFSIDIELNETEEYLETSLNSDSDNDFTTPLSETKLTKKSKFADAPALKAGDFDNPSFTAFSEKVLLQKYRNKKAIQVKKKANKTPSQKRKRKPRVRKKTINTVDNEDDPFPLKEMFIIRTLTLDEQKAAIENRKNSSNYINSLFKCNDCYKGFLNETIFNRHRLKHTDVWGKLECPLCKLRYTSKDNLHRHKLRHRGKYACRLCRFTAIDRRPAIRHGLEHKGTTSRQCPHCGLQFVKLSSFLSHLRIKHVTDFVCQFCGYTFLSTKGLDTHKMLKHRFEKDNNIEPPDDAPACSTCKIKFISDNALITHRNVSHPNTPDGQIRNEPIASYPRHNIPRMCEICNVDIKDGRKYISHFREHHPTEKRTRFYETNVAAASSNTFVCEHCGKSFKKKAHLMNHSVVHTGAQPYQCEECGMKFSFKSNVYSHVNNVHRPKDVRRLERKYPCHICNREFPNPGNRARHMIVHTDLRPHICEVCGKSYKSKAEVKSHNLHVHLKHPWQKKKRVPTRRSSEEPVLEQDELIIS